MAFGAFDPLAGNRDATSTLRVDCSGEPHETVRFCLSLGPSDTGEGGRLMQAGMDELVFQLFSDAARSQDLGSFHGAGGGNPAGGGWGPVGLLVDIPLDQAGRGSASRTIYGRVNAPLAVPGSYAGSYGGSRIIGAYDYATRGCEAIAGSGARVPAFGFSLAARVEASCQVAASTMNFGVRALLDRPVDATAMLTIRCTRGSGYCVGLGAGKGEGATVASRRMTGPEHAIAYSLYQDGARTQVWGDTIGTDTVPGLGDGMDRHLAVHGRVPPQSAPPAATYADVVVVTVTY